MHRTENVIAFHDILGNSYVPEQHADEDHHYLPTREPCDLVVNFDELLRRLRSALWLR
jgi:hypothetical protein